MCNFLQNLPCAWLLTEYQNVVQDEEIDPEALNLGKITELGAKEGIRTIKLCFDESAEALNIKSKG